MCVYGRCGHEMGFHQGSKKHDGEALFHRCNFNMQSTRASERYEILDIRFEAQSLLSGCFPGDTARAMVCTPSVKL
jgi:hypothetical protein